MSHNKDIGRIGEDVVCKFLMKHGFEIVERNYLKQCGEIDVVAKKESVLRFVEVKTVSCETNNNVNHETVDNYRAEDNVHFNKMQRMERVIGTYLEEKGLSDDIDWQFDVVTVRLNLKDKTAKVDLLENVILEW